MKSGDDIKLLADAMHVFDETNPPYGAIKFYRDTGKWPPAMDPHAMPGHECYTLGNYAERLAGVERSGAKQHKARNA